MDFTIILNEWEIYTKICKECSILEIEHDADFDTDTNGFIIIDLYIDDKNDYYHMLGFAYDLLQRGLINEIR